MSNVDEFRWGFDPIDPESYGVLPVAWWPVAWALLAAGVRLAKKRNERH